MSRTNRVAGPKPLSAELDNVESKYGAQIIFAILGVVFTTLALLVTGCNQQADGPVQEKAAAPGPAVPDPAPDKWLGTWTGPEGTFLRLAGGKGNYEVTIQNLDGPRTFSGHAVGAGIEFERDGAKEVIRATNGLETGMKWLAGKSNCLTVHTGEGYCKD